MYFFFPINTDAPVYHFPWATVSLIAVNCLVFVACAAGQVPVESWELTYGQISPLQWVTSNFVHGSVGHLLGNMFLLWSVGLIVEGKLGWRLFTAVFFTIGITQCAIEQFCMLGSEGGSLGASSIVFGLTAIALLWAPKNEIQFSYFVWLFFFVRVGTFDLSVLTYSLVVIAIELLVFTFQGFHIGTSALHLMGAVLGLGIGIFMLRRNLVDCEGWDLFSVMKGSHGRVSGDPANAALGILKAGSRKGRSKNRQPSRMLSDSSGEVAADVTGENQGLSRTEQSRQKILLHISDQKPQAAFAELVRQQHTNPSFRLEGGPLRKLAQGMIEHRKWNEAVMLLEEYLERFDEQAGRVRLQLALLLLEKQRRPRAALRIFDTIHHEQLSPKLQHRLQAGEELAHEMIDSGVIELSGQAFTSR